MWKELIGAFKKDNLYQQALAEACDMLETDGKMFEASVESLRHSDTVDIAVDIYGLDKKINRAERDVRKKVMTHLVISGGAELAHGLALVSVVIDIERIGDYTKNIHDLARRHPARLDAGPLEPLLSEIESGIADAFRDTIRAFKDNNEDLAREVMAEYKEEHSSNCEKIIDKVIEGQIDLSPADAATVALYTRYLKRIGSHSRNIATSIVNPFHRIGYKEEGAKI
jgi:phosphate uptake regulator